MRLILAGSRSFGAAVLGAVRDAGHEVAAVWVPGADARGTFPDPDDRLTRAARGLPVRVRETPDEVKRREVDLVVGAHSHAFISRGVREATRLGAIGYHPSLLPVHRGRDAVEWTVRMGDRIAGGSVYWMTDQVDAGPLAAQRHVHVVPGWDASALWREELFGLGVTMLLDVLADLDRGRLVQVPQDERCATWEPSIGRPPLFRPDLLQIGGVAGFDVVADRGGLRG